MGVLKTVGDEPDLSQRELAARMLVTGSTLTHHLDRLEADGFIDRTRDAADRRIVRVSLTAAGKHRRTELDAIVASGDDHAAVHALRSGVPRPSTGSSARCSSGSTSTKETPCH